MSDEVKRGGPYGNAKLNENQVRDILRSNAPLDALAIKYDVSYEQVRRIKRGVNWAILHEIETLRERAEKAEAELSSLRATLSQ